MKHNEHELEDFINFWKNKVDIIATQRYLLCKKDGVAPEKYKKFYSTEQLNEPGINEFKCVQPYQR